MTNLVVGRGPHFHWLGNAFSDLVNAALRRGMETDEAVCVGLKVLCDYARHEYGDDYLSQLISLVAAQAGKPLPENRP